VPPLLVEFSREEPVATSDGESILVTIDGTQHRLSRDAARDLQAAIGDAMTERREFLHTSGEHREDGRYVVARRGADSAGNAKVFESFARLERLYERLPDEFAADDVSRTGITGSRRHMLVRHFAEHPAFDCRITRRNPLTVEKQDREQESQTEVNAATAD
jgi:hypothetical protein